MAKKKPGTLLRCPFCGGEAVRLSVLDHLSAQGTKYVGCSSCDCVMSFGDCANEAELVLRFNRRAR